VEVADQQVATGTDQVMVPSIEMVACYSFPMAPSRRQEGLGSFLLAGHCLDTPATVPFGRSFLVAVPDHSCHTAHSPVEVPDLL
jgi:hypothetical protein